VKSFLVLFFVVIFSSLSLGRECRNGSCQSNQPLFQSPFSNLTGSNDLLGSQVFDNFDSAKGSNGSSFNLGPTFNSIGGFNSGGGRVHNNGGFLFVGNNPIFIGDQGEILVKDLTTGQLVPADFNTTSQVISIYQDWARRVENGECRNSRNFATAQRALNSEFNHQALAGGFQDGFSGGIANHQGGLGGTTDGGITQGTPQSPQQTFDPSQKPGVHASEENNSTSPQHPQRPEEAPKERTETFDKNNLKVFSDSKGNFFLMDPSDAEKRIFVGDGKTFSPVNSSGLATTQKNSFHLLINDSRYTGIDDSLSFSFEDPRAEFEKSQVKDASDILFHNGRMTLRCGTHLNDYKEVKGDEAAAILQDSKVSKTPKSPCDQFAP
jgi:hypothetical protein